MRRLLPLLLTAATAVAAAGCGADDVNPNALAEAAERTRDQGGVHMTVESLTKVGGQEIPLTMEGDADLEQRRMRMTFDMGGEEVEQLMIGTTMYMKMPMFEKAFGSEWVKADLEEILGAAGIDLGPMMRLGNSPADQLEYLRATADLEEVGKEKVDGVDTTHYKANVELRRYPDLLPEDERAEARRSIDRLIEMSGTETVPTEVWIGEDDLVRRQRMTISQTKPQKQTMTIDMTFSDFGKDVEVEEPSGEVKDITEIAKKGVREQAGTP